jgi:hypothetical protein
LCGSGRLSSSLAVCMDVAPIAGKWRLVSHSESFEALLHLQGDGYLKRKAAMRAALRKTIAFPTTQLLVDETVALGIIKHTSRLTVFDTEEICMSANPEGWCEEVANGHVCRSAAFWEKVPLSEVDNNCEGDDTTILDALVIVRISERSGFSLRIRHVYNPAWNETPMKAFLVATKLENPTDIVSAIDVWKRA